jgi:hypothetical protein
MQEQFPILPKDVYTQLEERARANKQLEAMKDTSIAMRAAPIVAGLSEAAKLRGGSGVNLNPLLAWSSGLPGADRQTIGAVIQQNPYVSPTDTIAKLMGMGKEAAAVQQQYLKERDKFFATQMGRPVGSAGIANALLKEELINRPKKMEERAYKEQKEQEKLAREKREAKTEEEKKALDDAWSYAKELKDKYSDEMGGIITPMSRIAQTLARAPKTGTVDIDLSSIGLGKYNFPLNALKNWQTDPETAQFYSDVESILSEIRKSKYGATLTGFELDAALREFGLGKVTPIQTLFTRLEDIRQRHLNDIRSDETLGRAKYGKNFDKFYDGSFARDLRGIKFNMQKKSQPKKKSPAASSAPAAIEDDELMQSLEDLESAFGE